MNTPNPYNGQNLVDLAEAAIEDDRSHGSGREVLLANAFLMVREVARRRREIMLDNVKLRREIISFPARCPDCGYGLKKNAGTEIVETEG